MKKIFTFGFFLILSIFLLSFVISVGLNVNDEETNLGECRTITLTPEQVQSLFTNYFLDAAKPKTLKSGAAIDSNNPKEDTNCHTINMVDSKGTSGIGSDIGCVSESSNVRSDDMKMNQSCDGDNATGMVLTDDLRLGRCENINVCSVDTNQLSYRNSISGMELVKRSALGLIPTTKEFTSNFNSTAQNTSQTSNNNTPKFATKNEVKTASTQDTITMEQLEQAGVLDQNIETTQRKADMTNLIKNNIKASTFEAQFQDVCTGQDASDRCKIFIYSFFDRHYNAYYSSTIVISTMGPAFLGISKKILGKIPALKNLGGKLADEANIIKGKFHTNVTNKFKDEVGDLRKELANSRVFKGMSEKDVAALEESLIANNGDDMIKILDERLGKNLISSGTTQPQRTFARYITQKNSYAKYLKSQMADGEEAAFRAIANADTSVLGVKPVARFIDKNPKYDQFLFSPSGRIDDAASISQVSKDFFKNLGSGKPVVLYRSKDPRFLADLASNDLEAFIRANPNKNLLVNIDGQLYPLTKGNLAQIKSSGFSDFQVLEAGEKIQLTPAETDEVLKALKKDFVKDGEDIVKNLDARTEQMMDALVQGNYLDNGYASALNFLVYNSYFGRTGSYIKQGLTAVVVPPIYWGIKSNDNSPLKAYFIGEKEMTNAKIYLGTQQIYNDAYIDFFVNANLSNGDFVKDTIIKGTYAVGDFVLLDDWEIQDKLNAVLQMSARDDVQDVVYTNSVSNCSNCSIVRKIVNGAGQINNFSKNDTDNYILEYPNAITDAKKGRSLALYSHHTNIAFTAKGNNEKINDTIDLEQAILNKTTCVDKINESVIAQIPLIGAYFKDNESRIGLATGILENVGFYLPTKFLSSWAGFLGGVATTGILDTRVRELYEGCVDTEEGYYINYTHKFEKEKNDNPLSGLIGKGKDAIKSEDVSQNLDKLNSTMDDLKNSLFKVIENKDKEFMQIYFKTMGNTTSNYFSDQIFLTWLGPNSTCSKVNIDTPTKLEMSGKTITGEDVTYKLDGDTFTRNGNTILKSQLLQFATTSNLFAGLEIPQSVTFSPANSVGNYFEMYSNGDFKILDFATKYCMLSGMKKQTGRDAEFLNYTGVLNKINLMDKTITLGNEFTILGGDTVRNSTKNSLIVDNNKHVINSKTKEDYGLFQSAEFEKGILYYRQSTDEFAIWIRIISKISGNNIDKFVASPTKVVNPDTNCEEPAIDLSITGNPNDVAALNKANEFNDALEHAGPYQYFETDDKIIQFYSKLVEGQCKEYMRVIDKKTNKIISDEEITGIERTDTGIKVNTADGRSHTLEFSNENGKPILSFDGVKSNLLFAQGRNGSFYFDPKTGEWYVGNSQILPLDDEFRELGSLERNGTTEPGNNPYSSANNNSSGKSSTGFSIPLFEGYERIIFVVLSLFFVLTLVYFTQRRDLNETK